MTLETRDFGPLEIDEKDIVTFQGPIFGFEKYSRFVFLYRQEIHEHFIWLQSVDEPSLCFILVQPQLIVSEYAPTLPPEAKRLLGAGEYMCWLLVSLRQPFSASTVNLKSPIVVNTRTRQAAQFVLEEDWPLRHPLLKEEAAEC